MKKALPFILLVFLFVGFVSESMADGLTLKPSGQGQWTMSDSGGQEVGKLKLLDGGYGIFLKDGQFFGTVMSNGGLQIPVRHVAISASQAQLYLDVLDAIKKLK